MLQYLIYDYLVLTMSYLIYICVIIFKKIRNYFTEFIKKWEHVY